MILWPLKNLEFGWVQPQAERSSDNDTQSKDSRSTGINVKLTYQIEISSPALQERKRDQECSKFHSKTQRS